MITKPEMSFKRSIIGYQISDNRGAGPCILAMRMAFRHLKKLPENFKFIADGYSAYPLAAQQFFRQFGDAFRFDITQVIGLTNDDEVSAKYRPYKQMIERLNRTYKASYRPTKGFDSIDGRTMIQPSGLHTITSCARISIKTIVSLTMLRYLKTLTTCRANGSS